MRSLSYHYTSDGWLSLIKVDVYKGSDVKEATVRTYAYDSYGKVTEIKDYRNLLSDGDKAVKKTYTYDSFDRVAKMVYTDLEHPETVMESYAYSYDKNSNIVEKTQVNNYPQKRVWEQLWGKYWYDKSNHKKYGKHGNVRKAKKSTDSHLKKYRKAIDKENRYMEKLQKNLGKQAIKSILLFGVGKVMGFALKGYNRLPRFIKRILPFGIKRFLSSNSTNYIRKSLQNIKDAQAQYKIVKNNFPKIKR